MHTLHCPPPPFPLLPLPTVSSLLSQSSDPYQRHTPEQTLATAEVHLYVCLCLPVCVSVWLDEGEGVAKERGRVYGDLSLTFCKHQQTNSSRPSGHEIAARLCTVELKRLLTSIYIHTLTHILI